MKKIVIIAPALAQWSEVQGISDSLYFLKNEYQLTFVDPLKGITNEINSSQFFTEWKTKIKFQCSDCDVFFGFSLGGVILQKCISIFERENKPLVFFSVPSFCDQLLYERLDSVINLIKEKTGCQITVGQNGWIWVKGPNTDAEIKARRGIEFIAEKVYIDGLTEKMEEWFEKK